MGDLPDEEDFIVSAWVYAALLLPFFGTAVGAAAALFSKRKDASGGGETEGFAAGVMTAAGFFSLLAPAVSASDGRWFPAVSGFLLGAFLILYTEKFIPQEAEEGARRVRLLVYSVTLHNIPEGMAVGVAVAGALGGYGDAAAALALSLGIAVQNVPEGSIIALPLRLRGEKPCRAFAAGVLSGAVEPPAAALALFATALIRPALPYVLSLAAGAMWSVTAKELLPAAATRRGSLASAFGFALMMWLDVMLG